MALDLAGALGAWEARADVAVAVPDHTRPMDVAAALGALLPRLARARVLIGLGLHRRMTAEELAGLAPFSPIQHDPDAVVPTAEVDGVPGAVARAVAGADAAISVGVAELHQYAGLSGGHKGVAVGCGGRQTIAALHHRDRVLAPGVRVGQLDGNPFRAAVDGLGRAAGCAMAILWVPAKKLWIAGPPEAALAEAARRLEPWEAVDRRWPGAVLRVPPAKAGSLYQASRAATYLGLSPSPPVAEGGTLCLHAACPEGLGAEAGFVAALRAHRPPWSALLTGPPPEGAGAQRAVMLALLAQRFRLRITGCARAEALRAVGLDATDGPAPEGEDWLDVPAPFARLPQHTS